MNRQINHKSMRVIVGLIAILLAPIVALFAGTPEPLNSISASYWTNSHDLFVGLLFAVSFYLFAYNGTGGKKDWEFYLSKFSCLFAACVALFPTKGSESDIAPLWTRSFAQALRLTPVKIHYASAVLLFICLIIMMLFFSIRAKEKNKPVRSFTYRAISILMAVGILSIFVIGKIFELDKTILYIEIWGLTLFGLGWLVAGSYK
ncbi:MAG: hypothetical protein PQJ58_13750 [Spirochaetales bacterium]|nr:hypothetical protein [Spirochaetales bacterium]